MNDEEKMKKTDQEIEEEREKVSETVNEFSRSSITLDMIMGDTKQETDEEKKRREDVSETDKECESKEDLLEPSPTRTSPRTQALPTNSRPLFIPDLFPSLPVRQPTNPYPSESLTSAERIPPPPPPPPRPTGLTSPQSRNRPLVWPNGKTEVIPAPDVWARTRRATVHRLDYLVSRQILIISGLSPVQDMREKL
ncbi:hypothetical protein AAG906_037575 [Vitis piasezkii]